VSNEISTSSIASVTNTSLVEPVIILALSEQPGLAIKMCREFNGIGKAAAALKIPTQTSYWGVPSLTEHGAGIATAFNGTEAVGFGNTAVSTGSVTVTAAEYGVAHALTDNVNEDAAIDAMELLNLFTGQMLRVLTLALDDDYVALFPSLSSTSGLTNTTLSVASMLGAQQSIRIRGTNADSLAYILDNKQTQDLESAISAASTSIAVYAMSTDRLIGYAPSADQGMGPSRQIMSFRNYPVFATGLTDTANSAVDVVGACVVPTSAYNDSSGATTHALMWKRLPRFETQRQAKGRSIDLVMTMRAGLATLQNGSGQQILSKA
jgi:hypothetical protein